MLKRAGGTSREALRREYAFATGRRGTPAAPSVRRRSGRRGLLLLLNFAALALVGISIFRSPWFAIESVEVRGLDRLPAEEVARLGGLTGANLFLLDPGRVADRIRAGTMARRVEVTRWLPNHVGVTVEERTAWAVWRTASANYLIDEEGVVLGPTREVPPLPVVFDVERHVIDPGTQVEVGAVALTQKLADLLPARIGKRPVRFEYGPLGGVKAVLEGGWEVRIGTGEDLDYKLSALQAMLADAAAGGRTVTYADVRFSTRPYYRAAPPPQTKAG